MTQNNPFGGVNPWGGAADAYKYPNPFCDIASVYIPTNLNSAYEWMEFLMLTMPPFMAVINRVVSYFLTDIEISDVSDDMRKKYEELFDDDLHLIQQLQDIGKDYFCFSGDTEVHTSEGLKKIKDLAESGKEVEVCGIDGQWHKTKFKSFGVQKTREISFGTRLTVRATADHHWWVDTGDDGENLSYVTSNQLKYWYKMPVVHIPRPDYTDDFKRGAVHGLYLGMGNQTSKAKLAYAEAVKEAYGLQDATFGCLKMPPPQDVSRDYWYGMFAGMAETCGYFQKKKRFFFLAHSDKKVLEACRKGFETVGFIAKNIAKRKIWGNHVRYYMPFNCQYLEETDFIGSENRNTFKKVMKNAPVPRMYTMARPVKDAMERKEEVFCCEEPETHTFALKGGVITSNCYGNSFVSLYLPFDRYLVCPDCHVQIHITRMQYDFDAEHGRFMCECPRCRRGKVEFKRIDRRRRDTSKVKVIRWNPKRIRLKVHPISGEIKYYYKLEEKFIQRVREGDPFYINSAPWGFIDTATGEKAKRGYENLFEFAEGQIYHMKDTVFSGLQDKIRGWAIPPLLPYFKLAYYIQLMRRYDEAIALDFIMPFRILYPQGQAPGGQDALTMVSMQTFIAAMSQMVEKKRANMTSIEVSPFAIGYELIGGEAKQLAPKESIQQAEQELLNAMGFPQELFAGTLSLQAAPVALRLFEREWNPLVDSMNSIMQWISDQVSRYFMWDPATVKLAPITLADDIEKKGLQMQAAAGQDISKQTAYRTIGIDYLKEQQRIIKEQQDVQRMQEKAQAEAQAQQANGAMGAGAEGGGAEGGGDASGLNGPGGDVGATPGDIEAQATELAQNIVSRNNPTESRQMLASIKSTNPTLYAMVKAKMQDLRQQLASQGKQQMIAQMQQQG